MDLFVNRSLTDAAVSATPNVMFEMGSDFEHENSNEARTATASVHACLLATSSLPCSAPQWFKNLDKIIHYVNLDGRVNAFYSTPMIFTQSLFDSNYSFPLKVVGRVRGPC